MKPVSFLRKVLVSNWIHHANIRSCVHMSERRLGSIKEAVSAGPNPKVTVEGWVKSIRKYRDVVFVNITDGSTTQPLQLVLHPDILASGISTDSSVKAVGSMRPSKGAGQDLELQAREFALIGHCNTEEFPLKPRKEHPPDYVRQFLHLRPRTASFTSLLRIRNAATQAINHFFQEKHFYQIHTPIITSNDCEGAGEVFQVQPSSQAMAAAENEETMKDYFRSPAYLTVSGQLHLEAMASALRKVYTFGPTFRAESSRGRNHLCEFYMVEAEVAFTKNLEDIMTVIEQLMKYTTHVVCDQHPEDVHRVLGGVPDEGRSVRNLLHREYRRLSYTEAVDLLLKHASDFKFPLKWGLDLQKEHERKLVQLCGGTPVFIVDFPTELKPFYAKQNEGGKTVAAVDLLCDGVGEVCGGSLREDRLDMLRRVMEEENIAEKYDWYLDLRRYGSVPHGGFGLGFERYLQTLLGIQNIRDTIPFPRSTHNLHL